MIVETETSHERSLRTHTLRGTEGDGDSIVLYSITESEHTKRSVYNMTSEGLVGAGDTDDYVERTFEGIALLKNVHAYMLNEALVIEDRIKGDGLGATDPVAVVMLEDQREYYRTTIKGNLGSEWYRKAETATDTPYTDYMRGEITDDDIVLADMGEYRLFDLDGNHHPMAMRFGQWSISSEHYCLDHAIDLLNDRGDVVWLEDGKRYNGFNDMTGESIYTLEFVWVPSPEDYHQVIERSGSNLAPNPHQVIEHLFKFMEV